MFGSAWRATREGIKRNHRHGDRCLSLVYGGVSAGMVAEVRYVAKPTIAGALFCLLAGSLARWEASLWPAGSRRMFEPLTSFKSRRRNTRFLRLVERPIPRLAA
jgi:hypothetical protein